jgi:hypothetical protein
VVAVVLAAGAVLVTDDVHLLEVDKRGPVPQDDPNHYGGPP